MCDSALNALERSSIGKAVNYEGIIDNLIQHTIPDHFKILMTNERKEHILAVGSKYSKGRGNREGEFKNDNERKEDAATPAVKSASRVFLQPSYVKLEMYSPSLL